MQIALRDRTLDLKEGERVAIPKGMDHKPVCPEQCTVLLLEPKGSCNTGNAGRALTDRKVEWIYFLNRSDITISPRPEEK
jgi:mannose-6-phosphate isomerase-like protein (cupin superfamily)